jgi:hypothetical protein
VARAGVLSSLARPALGLAWAALALGCGSAVGRPLARVAPSPAAVSFDYPAIGGARLSSESTRGRATVMVLITTYDLGSQVVLRELVELARIHEPRINVGVVVLEPPRNAPLVQAFSEMLELPFPVALADAATLEARGPFGDVGSVPTLVVLDPSGVETWREAGVVPVGFIRDAVDRALRGAPRQLGFQ